MLVAAGGEPKELYKLPAKSVATRSVSLANTTTGNVKVRVFLQQATDGSAITSTDARLWDHTLSGSEAIEITGLFLDKAGQRIAVYADTAGVNALCYGPETEA